MPQTETWTIGRLLQWTSDYLRQHGSETPRLDAEVLLAHTLGCQRIALYTRFDEEPDEAARGQFRAWVRKRAEGMPVAYLVGHKEFYSLSFRVTPDVLIPRAETEFVVISLLDLAAAQRPAGSVWQIADVGTGSGVIAVCAAKHLPESRITAIDISPAALAVAKANAAQHGTADRVQFVESDLLQGLPAEPKFDFILSNPPYVRSDEMPLLQVDVRKYEPHLALDAGPRGSEIVERLIPQAAERLAPGGWLVVEIGGQLLEPVRLALAADGRFEPMSSIKDLAGLPRVVRARRSNAQAAQ